MNSVFPYFLLGSGVLVAISGRFPIIEIDVNGWASSDHVTLRLSPRQYMQPYPPPQETLRCFMVAFQNIDVVILGDTFMSGYYTIYDRESGRIGFGALAEGSKTFCDDRTAYGL